MIKRLLLFLFTLNIPVCFAQNYVFIETGFGVSVATRSTMAHLPIGMTYLHNQWGVAFSLEANGRTKNADQANSLHGYSGGYLCFVYNIIPYTGSKLLVRSGISLGEYTYLRDQYPTSQYNYKSFETDRSTTAGLYLSVEGIIPSARKNYRGWGIEGYANIMKHSYFGLSLKYVIGNLE
jgi:hypothetical protein